MTDIVYCRNNAPYFAIKKDGGRFFVVQGNCHSWNCPRCGLERAKQEYGRIVEGCRTLESEGNELFFLTLTTRGRELSLEDAFTFYLKWTSKVLDAMYTKAKRAGTKWAYCQVTELKKRGHPHSHLMITFSPEDLREGTKRTLGMNNGVYGWYDKGCLRSDWLQKQVIKSGLGEQYDISRVERVEGASRYIAKYLFDHSMFDAVYPKNWRRVRYSQKFPKREKIKGDAMILITANDWFNLAKIATVIEAKDQQTREGIEYGMRGFLSLANIVTRKETIDEDTEYVKRLSARIASGIDE